MELVRLQLPDVDSERGLLRVDQGKGLKDRVVPIGTRALAWAAKTSELLGNRTPQPSLRAGVS